MLLEETVRALKDLFAGRPWPGGDHVPAMAGPLLPPPIRPGGPPVWVGGVADAAVDIAARVADGWNGWGLDARRLRREGGAPARPVDATSSPRGAGSRWWGRTVRTWSGCWPTRADRGLSAGDAWTGTAEDLRAFADRLAGAGCGYAIFLPGGPPDRLDLIARTLLP